VHTNASIFKYFKAANSHDSYNEPEEVYRLAKARGWTSSRSPTTTPSKGA
jgi:hypothetical protein